MCRGLEHFVRGVSEKERVSRLTRGQKAQMQQIAEVVEGSWLGSWLGTMQEEVADQMDTVEVYEMKNGMCEGDGVKKLN